MIVNNQIGVFADVNRAAAFIDAQLQRRIQGNQSESFIMSEAAKLHRFCGFLIEVSGLFGIIGIDGNNHAAPGHDGGVVGNGLERFYFVGPPIGKRGSANARGGELVGYFVTFQNVLEGADLEAKLFCNAKQHQDFVFAIAV